MGNTKKNSKPARSKPLRQNEVNRMDVLPEDDLSILGGGYQPKEPIEDFSIPSGGTKKIEDTSEKMNTKEEKSNEQSK